MEILVYLIKSTALLSLFFLIYEFLLKRDTFFNYHRFYLIIGIVIAVCLPLFTITKTVVIEEQVTSISTLSSEGISSQFPSSQTMMVENISFWSNLDVTQIILSIYILGVVLFSVWFIISLIKLRRILNYRPKTYLHNGIRYIETDRKTNPFTFFKTIVYNPNLHSDEELKMILHHERTHAQKWHSLDILLGQLMVVFHWFNPLIWLYSIRIDQNLEFIADNEIIENKFQKRTYQMSLLSSVLPSHASLPVNNFHSFTKIRIMMINKEKSHKLNRLKALFILPFIMVFLMSFQIETQTIIKNVPVVKTPEDTIQNNENNLLSRFLDTYNENSVLVLNGEKIKVKDMLPSLYRIQNIEYDKNILLFIETENLDGDTLKFKLKEVPTGKYLYVDENSNLLLLTKNESKNKNVISPVTDNIDTGNDETVKESDQKESELKIKTEKPKSLNFFSTGEDLKLDRSSLKDFFANRNSNVRVVKVQYELNPGDGNHKDSLIIDRKKVGDSIRFSDKAKSFFTLGNLDKNRQIQNDNFPQKNEIVSVDVFPKVGTKYVVGFDKNKQEVALRYEVDENTTDAFLNELAKKFAEVDVDFAYKNLKRDRLGKITKIKMSLNNRKGSQAKASNQDNQGIGTYIVGRDDDGTIYITAKN